MVEERMHVGLLQPSQQASTARLRSDHAHKTSALCTRLLQGDCPAHDILTFCYGLWLFACGVVALVFQQCYVCKMKAAVMAGHLLEVLLWLYISSLLRPACVTSVNNRARMCVCVNTQTSLALVLRVCSLLGSPVLAASDEMQHVCVV